ncbi:putative nucleoside-diphosphate-sugar epimerase [Streptomyces venezuelae]|uniref:NAD(P)-dependent oxidoreductase n=1 Tax=Streptomyces gardneri TaxID=66892 RepID=UPI0006BD0752|nr:NAD(P)H-binding protein [Streptomyces gardneri]ALO10369.1 putative nucleoside-diphosphate-sugar epimerase [Streptomyces venezuelae]QPK47379.1 NAD(P)H-binding protein [Streptomyces gardneri]WRK38807.1 NAD(P)H-binding protein [Streptomyces venezuelae]CUM39168.1 Flavin reductase [Streptomyces venezuelae]
MRLTVFGATGGIGREIVRQALASGHEVTAVVRDPARLAVTGERLVVHRADLADPETLRAAVTGRDAVLSGLGARGRADAATGVAARLTRSVLAAMEAERVRRLLVVSAAPVGPAAEGDGVLDKAVLAVISSVLKDVYADLRVMESALAASATDWTSVRPPKLTDKPLTGRYRTVVGGNPPRGRTLARADVAHAMLAMIDAPTTVGQGVGVAY